MFINQKTGEINIKIVYYGAPLSGKTTNLEFIHQKTPGQQKGELLSLKTHGDRTLFFDYMQLALPAIHGLTPKFNLYTVPGQVEYASTRKLVLQGADAVVFVVDSQKEKMEENIYSLLDLHQNLKTAGIDPQKISMVVQFNKRDLNDIMSVDEIKKSLRLEGYSIPIYEASALNGDGVLETLRETISLVVNHIQNINIGEESVL